MFLLTLRWEYGIMKKKPDQDRIGKESAMNFYQSMFMIFLLGFGIRFLYFRLNKGWIVTLVMAVIEGIGWLWYTDDYPYYNEAAPMYLLLQYICPTFMAASHRPGTSHCLSCIMGEQ